MFVVVDTNVFISAAIRRHSVPALAVEWVRANGVFLTSADTEAELEEVLQRPKFDRFTRIEARAEFFATVCRTRTLVPILERVVECRDPKDDKFLEVAVNGNAAYLVSGDADLLALHPFRGVAILTPADFLAAVGQVP